jgi:hypothetical protein
VSAVEALGCATSVGLPEIPDGILINYRMPLSVHMGKVAGLVALQPRSIAQPFLSLGPNQNC